MKRNNSTILIVVIAVAVVFTLALVLVYQTLHASIHGRASVEKVARRDSKSAVISHLPPWAGGDGSATEVKKAEIDDRSLNSMVNHGPSYSVGILLMVKASRYPIDKEKAEQIQAVFNAMFRARLVVEGTLAQGELISATESRVTIPAYPQQGQELKEAFNVRVNEILGEKAAADFLKNFEGMIGGEMDGYGETAQYLTITATEPGYYQFDYTRPSTLALGGLRRTSMTTTENLDVFAGLEAFLPGRKPTNSN